MKAQIEEIARKLCHLSAECETCQICDERYHGDGEFCFFQCVANEIIKHGYRKQSEGEWETIPDYRPEKLIAYRHICSVCKNTYKDIRPHGHKYCHECGAKMKGGAE